MAGANEPDPAVKEPGSKPSLLRIKRRRADVATEDIIVSTVAPRCEQPKRQRMDEMLLQLMRMGVNSQAAEAPPVSRRQRFRRVKTLELTAFEGQTPDAVQQLMLSGLGSESGQSSTAINAARQVPKASPTSHGKGGAAVSKDVMRDLAKQLSATARYKQIQSCRQRLQGEVAAGKGVDSLSDAMGGGGAFHLYDIICTDVDEAASEARAERKQLARERAREAAGKAAAEGAILMNYMPMVTEYLKEQGVELPAPGMETALSRSRPASGDAAAAATDGSDVDDDEFVYDVYVAVEGGEDDEGVPVVEVEEDEDPFDQVASEHDSDDSNAESYYANSYPDDEASGSSEDEEAWAHVRHGVATRGPVGPGQCSGERWDDEEYDLTRDSDDDGDDPATVGLVVTRGPKPEGAALNRQLLEQELRRGPAGAGAAGGKREAQLNAGAWGHRIR